MLINCSRRYIFWGGWGNLRRRLFWSQGIPVLPGYRALGQTAVLYQVSHQQPLHTQPQTTLNDDQIDSLSSENIFMVLNVTFPTDSHNSHLPFHTSQGEGKCHLMADQSNYNGQITCQQAARNIWCSCFNVKLQEGCCHLVGNAQNSVSHDARRA